MFYFFINVLLIRGSINVIEFLNQMFLLALDFWESLPSFNQICRNRQMSICHITNITKLIWNNKKNKN